MSHCARKKKIGWTYILVRTNATIIAWNPTNPRATPIKSTKTRCCVYVGYHTMPATVLADEVPTALRDHTIHTMVLYHIVPYNTVRGSRKDMLCQAGLKCQHGSRVSALFAHHEPDMGYGMVPVANRSHVTSQSLWYNAISDPSQPQSLHIIHRPSTSNGSL